MAKTTGMQTTWESGGAAAGEAAVAAALQSARHSIAGLASEVAALVVRLDEIVEAEERQRTAHADERERLLARCDALAAERDRAVEKADRADSLVGELRAYIEARMESDHAVLATVDSRSADADAATGPRPALNGRTSRRARCPQTKAAREEPSTAAREQAESEPASGEGAAAQPGERAPCDAGEPVPERGPEHPDAVEDTVLITVPVPRWLLTTLERDVASGAFPTVGAALLARCGAGAFAPVVCRLSRGQGAVQAGSAPQPPAPDRV
jgi:hypothetical protein